jgi:uncharacterized protein (TIGR02145 family)
MCALKKSFFLCCVLSIIAIKQQAQTVTDYDGNVYNTITIGTQIWLEENLKVTHYNNGDSLPNVTDNNEWTELTTGAYCNDNNDTGTVAVYGRLYNWYAVHDNRKLCPEGWNTPDDSDWIILSAYLGNQAGGKMKETGTAHWLFPNTGATNQSGFTALPNVDRSNYTGLFSDEFRNMFAQYWSGTDNGGDAAPITLLSFGSPDFVLGDNGNKKRGCACRCVRDVNTQIPGHLKDKTLIFYPNPAKDKIILANFDVDDLDVTIFSITGEILLHNVLNSSTTEINIQSLPKGIYIIETKCLARYVRQYFMKD